MAFLTFASRSGAGGIALIILTLVLAVAHSVSQAWIRRRHPTADQVDGALVGMLALPFVLLVAVSGVCVAGTTPGSFGLF